MSVGPHVIADIRSDLGGSADVTFAVQYDSTRAKRDVADDSDARSETRQRPYQRVVGPGFRHTYDDRLILVGTASEPTLVRWHSHAGTVTFYRDGQVGGVYKDWRSEPGTNHTLRREGSTWWLLKDGGDVLGFEESADTWLHPTTATEKHVRLRALYPGAAKERKIVLLYEGDAQDAASPFDVDKIPAPACVGVVSGAVGALADCTASRGLLVTVGVVLGSAAHGAGLQLRYALTAAGTGPRDQLLLTHLRSGADQMNGEPLSTFATTSHSTGYPRRLEKLRNTLFCTANNDTCVVARYVYDATRPWAIVEVERPGAKQTGVATWLADEFFEWETLSGKDVVKKHKSLGVRVEATGSPTSAPFSSTMLWTRNGNPEQYDFDADANLTTCSAGTCGNNASPRQYQRSQVLPAFTLGVSGILGEDGIWQFRRYTEQGLVDFVCDVVPAQGYTPTCELEEGGSSGDGDSVVITNGTMRRLERRYYDGLQRLRATAGYDPQSTNFGSGFRFPRLTDVLVGGGAFNWLDATTTAGTCPSINTAFTLSGTVHKFDVTVFDYDSDGDGLTSGGANETPSWSTGVLPDMLVARVNRRAEVTGHAAQGTCTVFERNARGDVSLVRKYADSVLVGRTELTYLSLAEAKVQANGRLDVVAHTRELPAGATLETLNACSALPYDEEGELVCSFVQQASGSNATVSLTKASGSSPYAMTRTTTVSAGASSASSFTRHFGWGAVYEAGVVGGNFTRTTYGVLLDATAGLAPLFIDEFSSTGILFSSREVTKDPNGFPKVETLSDAAGTPRLVRDTTFNFDGELETLDEGNGLAVTSYEYHASGAVSQIIEPDLHDVDRAEGTLFTAAGRIDQISRGGAVQQRFSFTRDGKTASLFNVPLSNVTPVAAYTYDSLRRLVLEDRTAAGQRVLTDYRDETRISRRRVQDSTGSSTVEDVSMSYDGLGRPTMVTSTSTGTIRRFWKWDKKEPAHLGTYGSFSITNNFNAGLLAYEEGDSWATFYEYDFAGRVVAIISHDGPLSAFNGANLSAIRLAYNSTSQELTSITYPSGRVATYTYGDDKERPTGVSYTSPVNTVASSITWEPYGTPKGWNWRGSSSHPHVVTRDLLGRITNISETFGGATLSTVTYGVDADGDVTTETDGSSAQTWLRQATTGNHGRTYTYETDKDVLKSWQDDGLSESLSYQTSGRRAFETVGLFSYTHSYSTTFAERLLSKDRIGVVDPREVTPTYDSAARMTGLDFGNDGIVDTLVTYGPLGNATRVTTSAGAYTSSYDAQTRRTKLVDPTGGTRTFRYAGGRMPLEERFVSGGNTTRYEHVMLGGEVIAQAVQLNTGTVTPYIFLNDRMGMTRKVVSYGANAIVRRVVVDAWGDTNTAAGEIVVDATASPAPSLGWRYPGQYEDPGGIRNNGWRVFVPEIGQYTSPEPLHAMTARKFYGPQVYGYAAARPMYYVDSTGKIPIAVAAAAIGGTLTVAVLGILGYQYGFDEVVIRSVDEANAIFGENSPDGDCFQHCLGSCVTQAWIGDAAEIMGDLREMKGGVSQWQDMVNNRVGAEICKKKELDGNTPDTWDECELSCLDAFVLGDLTCVYGR